MRSDLGGTIGIYEHEDEHEGEHEHEHEDENEHEGEHDRDPHRASACYFLIARTSSVQALLFRMPVIQ